MGRNRDAAPTTSFSVDDLLRGAERARTRTHEELLHAALERGVSAMQGRDPLAPELPMLNYNAVSIYDRSDVAAIFSRDVFDEMVHERMLGEYRIACRELASGVTAALSAVVIIEDVYLNERRGRIGAGFARRDDIFRFLRPVARREGVPQNGELAFLGEVCTHRAGVRVGTYVVPAIVPMSTRGERESYAQRLVKIRDAKKERLARLHEANVDEKRRRHGETVERRMKREKKI